jgi:hypothetical protein
MEMARKWCFMARAFKGLQGIKGRLRRLKGLQGIKGRLRRLTRRFKQL